MADRFQDKIDEILACEPDLYDGDFTITVEDIEQRHSVKVIEDVLKIYSNIQLTAAKPDPVYNNITKTITFTFTIDFVEC